MKIVSTATCEIDPIQFIGKVVGLYLTKCKLPPFSVVDVKNKVWREWVIAASKSSMEQTGKYIRDATEEEVANWVTLTKMVELVADLEEWLLHR